jgi:beta-galactosidase
MTFTKLPSILPRLDRLFDADWRFYRGDAAGSQNVDYDDAAWRRVDLPHDWSIEDLPAGERKAFLRFQTGEWRFRKGDDLAWKEPRLNDKAWQRIQAPADWREHSKYTKKDAWGWYRRELRLPAELRGRDFVLDMGMIGEVAEVFLNGRSLGRSGSFPPRYKALDWWIPLSRFEVKAGWIRTDGPNLVAVRVFSKMGAPGWHCAQGRGGLVAESPLGDPKGPFDALSVSSWATGYSVGGRGCYRKAFEVPKAWRGRKLSLDFDGVYMNAKVWLNGKLLKVQPYGYTAFRVELEGLRFGATNVVAVQVNNEGFNSRWYSGSGIYRHVRLVVTDAVRVAEHGVAITTPQVHAQLATVQVATRIDLPGGPQDLSVACELFGPSGRRLARAVSEFRCDGKSPLQQSLRVENPELWSPEAPNLHSARVRVYAKGKLLDAWSGRFGIRSLAFSAGAGFLLNGKKTLLKGSCMHHDQGILGSRAFDASEERRVRLMKENGFNALRTAHNPPSTAFLDACDRLGMLVIDEAFDMWQKKTNTHDYHTLHAKWWKRDMGAMIRRDRNHPCVIMWSTGNEIAEKWKPATARLSKLQAEFARALDPSRAVTEALSGKDKEWPGLDGYALSHDVVGYNYMQHWYERDHARAPERVMYQSESSNQKIFESGMAMLEKPYVIGDFTWTGFDYIGEASIGWISFNLKKYDNRIWTLAYCGDLDLSGFKRPQSHYRETVWGSGPKMSLMVHSPFPTFGPREGMHWGFDDVQAHWSWPGYEGKKLKVEVYTRCEKVELFLNGRRIGSQKCGRSTKFKAAFQVPYRPGALSAVGYEKGKAVARCRLETAGTPAALRLVPERPSLKAGGQDLAFVHAEVVDGRGRRVPQARPRIEVAVKGAATQAAFGSADPQNLESFQDAGHPAFEGRALLVLRSGKSKGFVQVSASSPGLRPARLRLRSV